MAESKVRCNPESAVLERREAKLGLCTVVRWSTFGVAEHAKEGDGNLSPATRPGGMHACLAGSSATQRVAGGPAQEIQVLERDSEAQSDRVGAVNPSHRG